MPYDPAWPIRYEALSERIGDALGDAALRIEHIGSTAIPGLIAKPVIDALVTVADPDVARTVAVPALLGAGFTEVFQRLDAPPVHYTCVERHRSTFHRLFHVHVAQRGHPVEGTVAFRDHLRGDPDEAARYQQLKLALAERYADDREAYTAAKSEYVLDVTARALGGP